MRLHTSLEAKEWTLTKDCLESADTQAALKAGVGLPPDALWSSPTSSTWSGEGARCWVRRRERASSAACARRSRHRLTD